MKRLLLFLLSLLPFVACGQYWNNPEVYRLNKVQPHDRIVPDGDLWRLPLDGTWRFRLFDKPSQATLSPSRWDTIRVPGGIEEQGYGVPLEINMRNEFPANPPFVPTDHNPTGVYARTFSLPAHWRGRRTIIKFGAVASAMYLYINGREVGYSQDSQTPAEWDITRYLRDGQNDLKVKVVRWCDGSRLEGQDVRRMSGITRSVELYSLPPTYISDIKVVADLDTVDFSTGVLDLMVDLSREVTGGTVEYSLSDSRGFSVDGIGRGVRLSRGDWFVTRQTRYPAIRPWSDTTPTLYTLTVVLRDPSGRETERITKKIGFRHIDIHHGRLRLNGHPMEIRGVNRHEHSMPGGHHVSPDEMRRDVALMKELGINAVRTSHYPDDELWYDLCDSAGIYIWDEANVNCSAFGNDDKTVAMEAGWLNPILDRVYNMYKRDRNHASVIAWSLGSECGNGYCMEEAYRFLKGKENSRPVVYEGAGQGRNTDIVCTVYPSVDDLAAYGRNPRNRRPFIMAEYCRANGNGMAGLKDFWDTIGKYPLLQGGFVADWMGGNHLVEAAHLTPLAYELQAVYTHGRSNIVTPAPQSIVKYCRKPYDIRFSNTKETVRIENGEFSLVVNLSDGSIASYRYHGRELLAQPLRWHFWRPPTGNDLAAPQVGSVWVGLDRLQAECLGWSPVVSRRDEEGNFELHTFHRLSAPDGATLRVWQILEVNPDGQLQASWQVVPAGQFRTLPILGFQFGLDTAAFEGCSFYGNIRETYPDRCAAQRVGRWYKGLADLSRPQYAVPQEEGRREAQWVSFVGNGVRLAVISPHEQGMMGFSVRRWSDSAMSQARSHMGSPDPCYTVTIDYRTAPLDPGASPSLAISGDSSYAYRFVLDPTGSAVATYPFSPHPHLEQQFAHNMDTRLATRNIEANRQPEESYGTGFPAMLVDGRRAAAGDWHHGWAGFHGVDTLLLSISLEHFATLTELSFGSAHSPTDGVVRPLSVEAQWSIDGRKWSPWQGLELQNPPSDLHRDSRRLRYLLRPRRAKSVTFVRLRVVCQPALPVWHPSAGQPSWLMVDEIELR